MGKKVIARIPAGVGKPGPVLAEVTGCLKDSTDLMKQFYEYAAHMRRQVFENPTVASMGGFTYIPLDDLDNLMVQMSVNHKALGTVMPKRRKK